MSCIGHGLRERPNWRLFVVSDIGLKTVSFDIALGCLTFPSPLTAQKPTSKPGGIYAVFEQRKSRAAVRCGLTKVQMGSLQLFAAAFTKVCKGPFT